jgi:hypothetical protein
MRSNDVRIGVRLVWLRKENSGFASSIVAEFVVAGKRHSNSEAVLCTCRKEE